MPVAEFNGFSIIQVAFPNGLAVASSRCELLFLIYRGAHVVERSAKRGKCAFSKNVYIWRGRRRRDGGEEGNNFPFNNESAIELVARRYFHELKISSHVIRLSFLFFFLLNEE